MNTLDAPQQRKFTPDILRVPLLGRLLRWKHSRSGAQSLVMLLAIAIIVDGLLGSQLAARNVATVGAWVHYRGLVVLALLLVGNLFCAACPFVLPRKLAKYLGRPERRWPQRLRNKWIALVSLIAILFAYELFDLWASPWWTAWTALAYFALAFTVEAMFTRSSFCMYICPLGTFNFLYSTLSPTQIRARDLETCRTCEGHECINGAPDQEGCQLELFVPTIQSNLNCTLCLDCVRACPHDNVALALRPPGNELFQQNWPNRLDLAFLAIIATFAALINAFAMTPPIFSLEAWLAARLHTQSEWLVLGLTFLISVVVGPTLLVYAAAWCSRALSRDGGQEPLNRRIIHYAYSFVPMGFAIWLAHYLFHFLTGAMTIVPAFQTFFYRTLNLNLLGQPNWRLAALYVPSVTTIQALQMAITFGGLLFAMALAVTGARRRRKRPGAALREALPWLLLLITIAISSGYIFQLPMEMRGSPLGG